MTVSNALHFLSGAGTATAPVMVPSATLEYPLSRRREDDEAPRPVDERPDSISESTLRNLLALRDDLERRGGLYARLGHPGCYRIRVRAWCHIWDGGRLEHRRRQLSIAIQSHEADAVRRLLTYWRSPAGREEWRQEKLKRGIETQKQLWKTRFDEIGRLHEQALVEDLARSRGGQADCPDGVESRGDARMGRKKMYVPEVNPAAEYIMSMKRFPSHAERIYISPDRLKDDPEAARKDRETYDAVRRRADAGWQRLPIWLRSRLLEIKSSLAEHGTIARRKECDRHGGFRVRVRVPHERYGRVHASVSVPDEHVADVWSVLRFWRAPGLMVKAKKTRLALKLRRERANTKLDLMTIKMLGEDHPLYQDTLWWLQVYMCMKAEIPPFLPPPCLSGHADDAPRESRAIQAS